MIRSSYRIATVWGIPIKVHISLLLALPFFAMDSGFVTGLLLEAGLFTSIVLHELGHSLVAIRQGCRVREILLMPIGGAAQMEKMPTRPLGEFLMAIAGPLVSTLLALGAWFAGAFLPLPRIRPYHLNIAQVLGLINFGLVFFNLMPAFPMDGGRVLRAALTPKFGRLRATFIAARLGKIMAVLFGIWGYSQRHWFLVAIAFFIFIAAGHEYRLVQIQEQIRGRPPPPPPDRDADVLRVSDSEVIVGPPPYKSGPGSRTDIRPDEEDPFRSLF